MMMMTQLQAEWPWVLANVDRGRLSRQLWRGTLTCVISLPVLAISVAALALIPTINQTWALFATFVIFVSIGLFVVAALTTVAPVLLVFAHQQMCSVRNQVEIFELQEEFEGARVLLSQLAAVHREAGKGDSCQVVEWLDKHQPEIAQFCSN